MDNCLEHHGILGQKWGKKNGPPYPLNYDDLSAEERKNAKKSAYDRGDIKEAYANRKYFTNKEVEKIIERFRKQNELLKMIPPEVKVTGADKIKSISNTLSAMGTTLGNVGNAVDGATKAYNSLAKVLNTFAGTNLKAIKEPERVDPYDTRKLEFLKKQEEYKQAKITTEDRQLDYERKRDKKENSYDTKELDYLSKKEKLKQDQIKTLQEQQNYNERMAKANNQKEETKSSSKQEKKPEVKPVEKVEKKPEFKPEYKQESKPATRTESPYSLANRSDILSKLLETPITDLNTRAASNMKDAMDKSTSEIEKLRKKGLI